MTPPVALAPIRLVKPVPGSKNPEPDDDVPVIVTLMDDNPVATVELADDGVAGAGAISLATSKP